MQLNTPGTGEDSRHRNSEADLAALVVRLGVGTIFMAQGWRKLLGAPGAAHGRLQLQQMLASKGYPAPAEMALATAFSELVCGAAVFVGFRPRVTALPLLGILSVAIGQIKWKGGFIGGWDWPFAVAIGTLAVWLLDAGRFSVDELFSSRSES